MNKTVEMISAPDTCSKCNGSGNVGYRVAGGICFRCNGTGSLKKSNPDADVAINTQRFLPASFYAAQGDIVATAQCEPNWLNALYSA